MFIIILFICLPIVPCFFSFRFVVVCDKSAVIPLVEPYGLAVHLSIHYYLFYVAQFNQIIFAVDVLYVVKSFTF